MARGVPTRRGVVLSLVTLPLGCVGGGQLAPPSKGGPPWLELRSSRFQVLTDLGSRDAEFVIARLDHVYELLAKATGYGQEKAVETRVFVFRTYEELQQFIPSRLGGMYVDGLKSPDGTSVPTLLIYGTFDGYGRTTFAHELAHRFMHGVIGDAHPWLHEGLAQYYSTVHGTPAELVLGDRDAENVAAAGKPWSAPGYVVYKGEELLASRLLPASKLVASEASRFWGEERQDGSVSYESYERVKSNYFVAWALVHMLLHEEYDYALAVQRALAAASATDGKGGAEIERIVENVPAQRLDEDFAEYLVKPGRVRRRNEPPAKVPLNLEVRGLAEKEILEYWVLLEPLKRFRQAPR